MLQEDELGALDATKDYTMIPVVLRFYPTSSSITTNDVLDNAVVKFTQEIRGYDTNGYETYTNFVYDLNFVLCQDLIDSNSDYFYAKTGYEEDICPVVDYDFLNYAFDEHRVDKILITFEVEATI